MKIPLTATSILERQDRRHIRAMALFAEIYHLVVKRLQPEEDPRHLRNELMDLLMQEGVEVLTDYTRAEMGLPPRDGKGWTIEEIHALEKTRLDLMTQPFPIMAVKS